MTRIASVTVYCSSSSRIDQIYLDAAAELGRTLARNRWTLVYGGNDVGMMGVLAGAVRGAGGKVIGVTPQLFIDKGVEDQFCELHVTACMRGRKAKMEECGDAFIALPGGLGTLEEFFEIVCGKQLAYHNKAIVLLNIAGYYDPLLKMIEHGLEKNFVRPRATQLYFVARSVDEAIEYLHRYEAAAPSSDLSFETDRAVSS